MYSLSLWRMLAICIVVQMPGVALGQQQNQEGPMLEVTSDGSEIKTSKNGQEQVVGTVKSGTRLWALQTNGQHYWVIDPKSGKKGWIRGQSVRRFEISQQKQNEVNQLGNRLESTTDEIQRISIYKQMIPLLEKSFGDDHPSLAAQVNNFAQSYISLKDYDRAEPLLQRSVDICRVTLGESHPSHIYCVNSLAHMYILKGDLPQAATLLQSVVDIQKSALGDSHPEYAVALKHLANIYFTQGKYDFAKPLLENEMRIIEATNEGEITATYSACLNNLGLTYMYLNDYARAEPTLKKSLQVASKLFGERHPNYLVCLESNSLLYDRMQQTEKANSLRQKHANTQVQSAKSAAQVEAEALLKSTGYLVLDDVLKTKPSTDKIDENGGTMVVVTGSSAQINKDLNGRQKHAVSRGTRLWLLRTEGANCQVFEPNRKEKGWIGIEQLGPLPIFDEGQMSKAVNLVQQADKLSAEGKLTDAIAVRKRAIKIISTIIGDHPVVADRTIQLGDELAENGDFELAASYLQRGLEIQRKTVGNDHPFTAQALNSLAGLYDEMGSYYKATQIYLECLTIIAKTEGLQGETAAAVMNNLGLNYYQRREFESAEKLYDRSRKILGKKYPADHPALAEVTNNLALVYQSTGRINKAVPLLKNCLVIAESQFGKSHRELALPMVNLGNVLRSTNKHDEAESVLVRCLKLCVDSLGNGHATTQLAREELAKLYQTTNRAKDAVPLMDDSRRAIRQEITRILPAFPETIQENYILRKDGPKFSTALSLGLANKSDPNIAAVSADWLINGKSVIVDAMADSTLLQKSADPTLRKKLKDAQANLSTTAIRNLGGAETDDSFKRQMDLEQEIRKLKLEIVNQQLAKKSGDDWLTVDDIRKRMSPDQVLVNVAKIQVFDFSDNSFSDTRYLAWLIPGDSDKPIEILDLGPSQTIDSLVSEMGRQMKSAVAALSKNDPDDDELEAIELDYHETSRKLGAILFDPLQQQLKGVKELIISPDGYLWNVPWVALVDKDDKYLIDTYLIRLVGSGRELAVQKDSSIPASAPVMFANPNFDLGVSRMGESRSYSENGVRFSPGAYFPELPGTEVEAISVKPSLEQFTNQPVTLLVEDRAQEIEFKKLENPRVLVFSTHGYFTRSTMPTAPEQQQEFLVRNLGDQEFVPPINPLLRCGLGLAGSNNRVQAAAQGKDDGILTGLEIVATDLRGTELVVLSACETGLGDIRDGQGVSGLRQAFLLAGADSVVATLWQVPDRDSALIMNDFFKNLAEGQSRSEALRNAQLKRIQSRRERYGAAHPFYWAAWTLTGS